MPMNCANWSITTTQSSVSTVNACCWAYLDPCSTTSIKYTDLRLLRTDKYDEVFSGAYSDGCEAEISLALFL